MNKFAKFKSICGKAKSIFKRKPKPIKLSPVSMQWRWEHIERSGKE